MMKRFRRRLRLWLLDRQGRDTENFTPHGVPVHIPRTGDLAVRYLLARGKPYEQDEAGMIRAHLRPGMNVIELGGCYGVISALIRACIGPDARHLVVEANPDLVPACRANASRGADPGKTEVIAAAVDYSGAATVSFARGHNAHVGHVARAGESGFTVPALRLSDLAARLPPGPFALVCDIEGAELTMLGAETALLARLSVVVIETHPGVYPDGTADTLRLESMLTGAGLRKVAESGQVIGFVRGI